MSGEYRNRGNRWREMVKLDSLTWDRLRSQYVRAGDILRDVVRAG